MLGPTLLFVAALLFVLLGRPGTGAPGAAPAALPTYALTATPLPIEIGTPEPEGKLEIAACQPTLSDPPGYHSPDNPPPAEVVGTGHTVHGTVMSSLDCGPIAGARVEMWPANLVDYHDPSQAASVFTGSSGMYTFTCAPASHIHMRISASGYRTIYSNQYHPQPGAPEGRFDIVLAPAP